MTPQTTYGLTIRKVDGVWKVVPDTGSIIVKVGDQVTWQLDAPGGTTAHLQFGDGIFEASTALNEHWVSALEPGQSLDLTVSASALPEPRVNQRSYSYAVMVIGSDGPQYAIGNNPPPDLDVGK